MKLILILNLLFISILTSGTTYYVDSLSGKDTNNGSSPYNPWNSIERVNSAKLYPGDSILFKRGNIFRGNLVPISGSISGFVTYAAYGAGIKPKLYGSIQKILTTDWIRESTNIWISKLSFKDDNLKKLSDVGNIIFNNEAFCGIKVKQEEDLNNQGKFWYDYNNGILKIYSASNPAVFYTSIEIALRQNIINLLKKSYISFRNLDIRYGAAHGIGGSNSYHINIIDIDFSYIGGGFQRDHGDGKVRYGNGVEFWGASHDIIVERCSFNQIYDAAITAQGVEPKDSYEAYNIYFRYNIIKNCEYSFELWGRGPDSYLHDIYFENNTCLFAGYGWGHIQRPDPNGTHLLLWTFSAKSNNIYVVNNIFYESINWSIRGRISELGKIICDNNCWYQSSGPIAKLGDTIFDFATQWAQYKQTSGQDAHSIAADPLLNSDYTLSKNSPCVGSGIISESVIEDYKQIKGPLKGKTNMGAYE